MRSPENDISVSVLSPRRIRIPRSDPTSDPIKPMSMDSAIQIIIITDFLTPNALRTAISLFRPEKSKIFVVRVHVEKTSPERSRTTIPARAGSRWIWSMPEKTTNIAIIPPRFRVERRALRFVKSLLVRYETAIFTLLLQCG